jgi:hypothetical protein
MEGTCEQNEYWEDSEINFILSAKTTKIKQMSSEEMGGKYETERPPGLILDRRRRRRKKKKFKKTVSITSFQYSSLS